MPEAGGDRITARAPSIEASGLSIGYPGADGATIVLSDVDLRIEGGDFLTVLGPSGCGKSTLLRVIADLLPPLAGALSVLGHPPVRARSRREVAFVFQDPTLLPWRTVRENVELPLQVGRGSVTRPVETTSDALLELVGLAAFADRYPDQLSGGQRQRVAIARALAIRPAVLLLDEPLSNLDLKLREEMRVEIAGLQRRLGITTVFVTHDQGEALVMSDRIAVMNAGAPSPGMNTAARAAIRLGLDMGHIMLGIHNGFEGLIHGEVKPMNWMGVSGWASRGGSVLGTTRHVPKGRDLYAIARVIEDHRIDALLMVGGWSAYEAAYSMLRERTNFPSFNLPMICLPASINNNLPGSELSIGADTALNNIVHAVDKIKQSAVATRRCFVVEVMGHWCGYLAMMGALATGAVFFKRRERTLADVI